MAGTPPNEITSEQLQAILARYDEAESHGGTREHREYERFMGVRLTPLEVVEIKQRLAALLEREGR